MGYTGMSGKYGYESDPSSPPPLSLDGATALLGETLSAAPPALSVEGARELLAEAFGLEGSVTALAGERDANFHVACEDGIARVLKIAHPAEDPAVTNLQTEALLHLERVAPMLPVPRMVPARTAGHEVAYALREGGTATARVLTYLEGEPLQRVAGSTGPSTALCEAVGELLARLGAALESFDHRAADRLLPWDIRHAARLAPLSGDIADRRLRGAVERHLEVLDEKLWPRLERLRRQVVHNDLNPHNVLVCPEDPARVAVIIDFGDMVRTPLIVDVAVGASYLVNGGSDPLGHPLAFVRAYHRVRALEPDELAVLPDLIVARWCTAILITSWRASRQPANRGYILRNSARAIAGLDAFERLDRRETTARFVAACEPGAPR